MTDADAAGVEATVDLRRGIALTLLAMTCLILLDASGKWLGGNGVPVAATSWSRYAGHLAVVVLLFAPGRGLATFATRHPGRQLLRGLLSTAVTVLYFAALTTLPLAAATSVFFLTPLLLTLFSMLFLRERAGWAIWLAVLAGFAGVLIVARPGTALPLTGVALALAAAVVNALYHTLTRAQAQADSPQAQVFHTGLIGAAALTVTAPFWWQPFALDAVGVAVFAGLGVLGAAGHLLMIRAYRHAPASRLAPWMYLQLLLSIAIGYLVFGDVPDAIALAGMAVIVASPQIARLDGRVRG